MFYIFSVSNQSDCNRVNVILLHNRETTSGDSVVVRMTRKFIIFLFCIIALETNEVASTCDPNGKSCWSFGGCRSVK